MTPAKARSLLGEVPPVLTRGRERLLATPPGLHAWRYTAYNSTLDINDVVLVANTTAAPITTGLVGSRLVSTVRNADARCNGTVHPGEITVIQDHT